MHQKHLPRPFNSIILLGPTASGKTGLGVQLARHFNGCILSADSRQVYRGMDIGTGKDLEEYQDVPYALIDILPAGEEYSLFGYARDFVQVFSDHSRRGILPIIVGGTGLYLDAIVFGYDMKEVKENAALREELSSLTVLQLQERLVGSGTPLHNETDLNSRKRLIRALEIAESPSDPPESRIKWPKIRPLIFGIEWPPEILRKRIAIRLKQRLNQGLIAEARLLHKQGLSYEKMVYYGLEYRFLATYLQGELNRNDMTQKLQSAICKFAKRQRTWFRRMECKGAKIHWLNPNFPMFNQVEEVIDTYS